MTRYALWTAALLLAGITTALAAEPGSRRRAFLVTVLAGVVVVLALAGAEAS
ncbi:MAG TPA: hypothetical protein VMF51_18060 [Nocardioides sp.]|uniref:hypothetical protein n=1 Tax=Nocardioides sp. TaxID=35761 RepID=UPI002BF4FFBE|nr:hypothetical protein [Nocardioides sp.]HTW17040.1 hypothetical protein [Nocardioides sp.]